MIWLGDCAASELCRYHVCPAKSALQHGLVVDLGAGQTYETQTWRGLEA